MPLATRSMLLAGEKSSSKEVSLTGKENVRPSTSRGKKVSTANHREELRRRVSLSSNVEKKKEKSNAKTSQLSESFVKKTPFHVHCDDKNVAESESKDCCEDKRVSEEIAVSLARREEESVQVDRYFVRVCLCLILFELKLRVGTSSAPLLRNFCSYFWIGLDD